FLSCVRCLVSNNTMLVLCMSGVCVCVGALSHLRTNLCKWCESSVPLCEDSVCLSNCSLTSFCTSVHEICVAIWRKNNESLTVQTLCHDPALPLEGVAAGLRLNSSSRDCVMRSSGHDAILVCSCQGEQECNDRLLFNTGPHGFSKLQSKDVIPVVAISLVPPVFVALVATATFYLYRMRRPGKPSPPTRPDWPTKHPQSQYQSQYQGHSRPEVSHTRLLSLPGDVLSNLLEGWGPRPQQLPITLEALVGKGRVGEAVAVKVFTGEESASWSSECSILSDPHLRHDNVVRFLAAEARVPQGNARTQYWLVLAYHHMGNLQNFLSDNILSWEELVAMAGSIARGLAHLHSDTTPTGVPKVPVAHRDLKSSNIVLKSREECVICDFGLALRLDLSRTADDFAYSGQVGTARYMAPEVLESRVNLEDLEAFKQMDVYSMALVLWEMISRCSAVGEVGVYQPAFGSRVCEQPCIDSMRDLVLRDRGRPDIPPAWTQHQGMGVLCSTIIECWDHDPEARLTAHCVVERFKFLDEEGRGGEEEEASERVCADSTVHPSYVYAKTTNAICIYILPIYMYRLYI
uniref:TGF-beta receptor type-2 n=1 Tax=Gadus morhua TaxID=8049 RepID=A0A8C4ZJ84_GADMO